MGFYFLSHLNWLVHFRLSRCMLFFVVSIIEFDLVTLTACMFFSFFLLQRQSTLQILTSGSGTPAKTIHYFVSHITLFLIFRSILQFFFRQSFYDYLCWIVCFMVVPDWTLGIITLSYSSRIFFCSPSLWLSTNLKLYYRILVWYLLGFISPFVYQMNKYQFDIG